MSDDDFEWDDAKATSNLAKHQVSFGDARAVFSDPQAVELLDDREQYGEERWNRIGAAQNRLLTVCFTDRAGKRRLISARQSTAIEKDAYVQENS